MEQSRSPLTKPMVSPSNTITIDHDSIEKDKSQSTPSNEPLPSDTHNISVGRSIEGFKSPVILEMIKITHFCNFGDVTNISRIP